MCTRSGSGRRQSPPQPLASDHSTKIPGISVAWGGGACARAMTARARNHRQTQSPHCKRAISASRGPSTPLRRWAGRMTSCLDPPVRTKARLRDSRWRRQGCLRRCRQHGDKSRARLANVTEDARDLAGTPCSLREQACSRRFRSPAARHSRGPSRFSGASDKCASRACGS